jgi:hypothetical protein
VSVSGLTPIGEVIANRYRVVGRLGRGGMGAVYRVVDESNGTELALKRLGGKALPSASRADRLRFRREFHTMARLRHPRIVRVFDYGVDDLGPFYTMELLDGQDARDLGLAEFRRACLVLRDVALALAFLHSKRLIHRDLAPRNVRCTSDGRAKLIDFGVLATVGFCGDVAGTPPMIAPENVRGLPIDERSDIYSLGALAYWLLTGKHAFPARRIDALEAQWRQRPVPPSSITPSVPGALDELVMSMLSEDALGRPASAAEVIDRLQAVGGLPPDPAAEAARGYLASAALVGRQRELEQLRRRLDRARRGDGRAVVIESPFGGGKSRLLNELGLEAQIAGAVVLKADSESAGHGPYGVIRELARGLLASAPAEAIDAALPRVAVIGRIIPELERIGPGGSDATAPATPDKGNGTRTRESDPAEERLRMQAELSGWFVDVSRRRTLVLLVDDVQRADEASAALLGSLAHLARLCPMLVAVTLRTDESPRAPGAVAALRDAGLRMRLGGLSEVDVEGLARALFGDVPHLARLSKWLHEVAGGSPLHVTEAARHAVEQGLVRFVDGMWLVPETLPIEDVPKGLIGAMEAHIASLSPSARALAEPLSVFGGQIGLDLCIAFAEGSTESEVFAALDELIDAEVLVGSRQSFRFRHDGLREALLRGLADERRRSLHLRVGRALAGTGDIPPDREGEVGWHLWRGGDRGRAAELLAQDGRRLYQAQSFADAAPALEAALQVIEAKGERPREVLEIRRMLMMSGCMADRAVALRYEEGTMQAYARASGLVLAARLGRFLGGRMGLALGFAWAGLRWLFTRRRSQMPSPIEASREMAVTGAYAATVHAVAFELDAVGRIVRLLEPLGSLRGRIPRAAYLVARNVQCMPLGYFAEARRNATEGLEIAERDRLTPISEMDRRTGIGAVEYILACIDTLNQRGDYAEHVARMRSLDLRFFEVAAQISRLLYHRFRGEEEQARGIESATEVLFVQLGSVWLLESQLRWLSSLAYGMTRDVLGLKRSIDDLERQCEQGLKVHHVAELARGEYQRERGHPEASMASLEQALARLPAGDIFLGGQIRAAMAETAIAAGELERARALASEAERLADPAKGGLVPFRSRAIRALALAEATLGDVDGAARRLDNAITEAEPIGSPSVSGALHELRARISFMGGDVTAYEKHLRETERWYRPTRNPALVARLQRVANLRRPAVVSPYPLEDAGAEAATAADAPRSQRLRTLVAPAEIAQDAVTQSVAVGSSDWISSLFKGLAGAPERAATTLAMLVDASGAERGYLYLFRDQGIELVAPLGGDEPPEPVSALLQRVADAAASGEEITVSQIEWKSSSATQRREWRPIILETGEDSGRGVIGIAAVVGEGEPLQAPDSGLVVQLARQLLEAGDATARRAHT